MNRSTMRRTVITPSVGCAPRSVHASSGSERAVVGDRGEGAADALEERRRIGVTVALDRVDARRIGPDTPERHRLVRGQRDDALHLPEPVAGKLGEVRPDLAGLPALVGGRIGIGQAGRKRRVGMLGQPALRFGKAAKQGVDVGGHRPGRSTTGAVSAPSRSIASVTVSPGSR